ncbi:tetrapyrrole biosynthesis, uroporphyrinogen III synthase, partial [Russula compacta]
FYPLSLPVLEATFENIERLSHIIRGEDDEDKVDGVIVTSARAVEACANAGAAIDDWRAIRFYAVGPATAALLAQLPNPPQDVRGTESGTAERLARYIAQDATKEERLLYLTGDKNRDTLSRIVREALGEGVIRELRVYATRGVRDFEGCLARALRRGEADEDDDDLWWIVFFAPSAAAHALPALRAHFSLAMPEESSPLRREPRLRRARIAAIGPTTASYLREEARLSVDAVAEAPNADSVVAAVESTDME